MEIKYEKSGKLTRLIVEDKAFTLGKVTLADSNHPYFIKHTNNAWEFHALDAIKMLQIEGKAECLVNWQRGNFCDDPYGRPYRMGTIDCSIWDLRKAFGVTEPLDNFLDFETKLFLKGQRCGID